MKVLLRSPNWLGDAVMAFPAVRALRKLYPLANISVLTREYLHELWTLNNDVDYVCTIRGGKTKELITALSFRKQKPDIFITFPKSFISALTGRLSGARTIIGFSSEFRDWLLTHPVSLDKNLREHQVQKYLRLLSVFGVSYFSFTNYRLDLLQKTSKLMSNLQIRLNRAAGPIVAFNPGAFYGEAKCWPATKFVELGKKLVHEGCKIIIVGSKKEKMRNQNICKEIAQGIEDLTGKTTLYDLASVLINVDCLVTNDTGTMHFAMVLGTPVVAIFGSTDPDLTGPWTGKCNKVIKADIHCSPCFKKTCPQGTFDCFKNISVEEVANAVFEVLNGAK